MFKNLEGQRVPAVTFKNRIDDQWVDVTTEQLFKGRTVVVFALPGAYTPTCSSTHLPRYNELAPTVQGEGRGRHRLPVGQRRLRHERMEEGPARARTSPSSRTATASSATGMGLLVDKSAIGFGKRSWRYSMLVKDGVIDKMFIEPLKDGDPFEVSDADTMLKYIDPKATAPEPVVVFSKPGCPHCARAKELLKLNGVVFEEVSFGQGHHLLDDPRRVRPRHLRRRCSSAAS